jgi:hypothetical protein
LLFKYTLYWQDASTLLVFQQSSLLKKNRTLKFLCSDGGHRPRGASGNYLPQIGLCTLRRKLLRLFSVVKSKAATDDRSR